MTNRRIFLRNSALAMVGAGTAPLWLERALYAADAPSPRKKILVAIFQRGAADGLNVVVPHGEKAYYDLRPTIAVPRPRRRQARRCGHRSRRLLRPASVARAAQAAVRPAAPGHRGCGRLARSHALAFRRAGLHGIRHAGPESHRERLDEPRAAAGQKARFRRCGRSRSAPALPRAMRGSAAGHRAAEASTTSRCAMPQAARRVRADVRHRRPIPCCRPPAARRSKPWPCCNPSSSSPIRPPAAPNIRAAASATACSRSRS